MTPRRRSPRRRRDPRLPPLESQEQNNLVNFVRGFSLSGKAYVIGTRRSREERDHGTHQTPGLADLWITLPAREDVRTGAAIPALGFFWEMKSEDGTRSPKQIEFGDWCVATGTPYGFGTFDDCLEWLVARGQLRPEQVGAHRRGGV